MSIRQPTTMAFKLPIPMLNSSSKSYRGSKDYQIPNFNQVIIRLRSKGSNYKLHMWTLQFLHGKVQDTKKWRGDIVKNIHNFVGFFLNYPVVSHAKPNQSKMHHILQTFMASNRDQKGFSFIDNKLKEFSISRLAFTVSHTRMEIVFVCEWNQA